MPPLPPDQGRREANGRAQAAHLYRDHGFELVSADAAPRWGRERITYQRYELELATALAERIKATRGRR